MFEYVIFDVDGTLIDTGNAVWDSYQRVILEEFGRNFSREEMEPAFGVPTVKALELLGFKDVHKANRDYMAYLMEEFKKVGPFEGIQEVLEKISKKGLVTGIVTSREGFEVRQDPCLARLLPYFNHVICADDTEKHKPNPEPALKFLEMAGATADKTLYLGDTAYDSGCAHNAGIPFALALWGAKDADSIPAQHRLKAPGDILELLK